MVVVVIYDSVLYQRSGAVGRWANALERNFVINAKQAAPKRSGALAAGISGTTTLNPAAKQALMTVSSSADHTMYVLKGTTGPIMSRRLWGFRGRTGRDWPRGIQRKDGSVNLRAAWKKGYALKLKPGKGYGAKIVASVSGQEANNFFAAAADATARRHSSLRGFSPGFTF